MMLFLHQLNSMVKPFSFDINKLLATFVKKPFDLNIFLFHMKYEQKIIKGLATQQKMYLFQAVSTRD